MTVTTAPPQRAIGTTIDQALHIALGHHQAGRLAEAEALYRQILAHAPDHPDALHFLGALADQVGQLAAAIALIGRAIAVNPANALYHSNLGEVYRRSGQLDRALDHFRRAIALQPDLADAHKNLGRALKDQGRLEEAIAAYQQAIALRPTFATAYNHLGGALRDLGRHEEAIAAFRRAIEIQPDLADGHNNLGCALKDLARLEEAVDAFHRAIGLKPAHVAAHNNLGNALRDQGRLDEAIDAFHRTIAISPAYATAHGNLGIALKEQGRIDDALACFRKAIELEPDLPKAASNYLLTLHYHPGYDAQALLAEHRQWARRCAGPLVAEIRPHPNDRAPERKLRVGFVSADFRGHPVGRLLVPLFANHDRRRISIVAYSDVRAPDALTAQLEALADEWCVCVGQNDQQLAERNRGDRIDILVDLALHTAGNRMLVFARKPAPVQVTMLGLPSTTGLDTIAYRLTDPWFDPRGSCDGDYSEQSIRLPRTCWCYQPPADAPAVTPLPSLKTGFITFGCLNQFAKVSSGALQLWVRILQSVPGSHLVLQAPPGSHRDRVRALFAEAGIAPERLAFDGKVPLCDYLARHQNIDLCLDPCPYTGGVTTMDALWMGVPVITLAGRTGVGRSGVSILSNLGLPELIAQTPEQYIDRAVALAGNLDKLSALRGGFRQRMQASPLMDGPQYAADVEAAFRLAWRN